MEYPANGLRVLARNDFGRLFEVLEALGYEVVGPALRNGAITLDRIGGPDDLPIGWQDRHAAGSYRLVHTDSPLVFGFGPTAQGAKRWLFPPRQELWRATRTGAGVDLVPQEVRPRKLALLGLRACDLEAIATLDRVLGDSEPGDPHYRAQRRASLLIGVDCQGRSGTCFCPSHRVDSDAHAVDLHLIEVLDEDGHRFLVRACSEKGKEAIADLPLADPTERDAFLGSPASDEDLQPFAPAEGLIDLLYRNAEHPHWNDVASRCLACGNCTSACPTCFCTTVEVRSDLSQDHVGQSRLWDSCFNTEFSYIHGGSVRSSTSAKYRQWITHKFAAWVEQFGRIGCVGCGRCITWCPAGIDLRDDVAALKRADRVPAGRF